MRKRLVLTLALGAVVALVVGGIAVAAKPTVVQVGNLKLTFNGGFTPTALPKSKLTPITLNVSGKIADHRRQAPAGAQGIRSSKRTRTARVNAKGVPTCKQGKLEATTTAAAEKACKTAIIGNGTTDVEVQFAESAPIPIKSKLLALQRRHQGREDDHLHPRLPDQPDRRGDRDHGQNPEDTRTAATA